MKNHGAFIVIKHYYHPLRGTDQVQVNEEVTFVDRLKNHHLDDATVIVDFLNRKLKKNRAVNTSFDQYMEYLNNKYPTEMNKLNEMFNMVEQVKQEMVDIEDTKENS